jgi:hypothetical protein
MSTNTLRLPLFFGLVLLMLSGCGLNAAQSRGGLAATTGVASPPTSSTTGAASGGGSQKPADVTQPNQVPAAEGPRVERTAQISLAVGSGKFDSTLNDVITIVDQAGGYIAGSEAQAQDGLSPHSGRVSFQVPATQFDQVLTQIRREGTPETIAISGNDVSLQYVDLQARLRNLEAQRNAILGLMQQARTVGDTIQIQTQLGQITGQIEQLTGQISYFDHATRYAAVTVSIHETGTAPGDEWGLKTAANRALHNFVNVINFVVLAVGTLAPLLIVGLALAIAGWRWRGRLLRRPS